MQSKQVPFWLLVFSLTFLLIIATLIQDGMFMDGMLYTCVAKNLANGLGSFWFPYFNQMGVGNLSSFHEHPPLVFGIQALFFKLLGNSLYVERFYSLLTALITGYLIVLHWRALVPTAEQKAISWFPVLCTLITPVVFWSYANNMQENTMGIFTLAAVYFAIQSLQQHRGIPAVILAGVFVFLASFSKGIPGFFPLATIGIYGLVFREVSFRKMMGYSLILVAVPVGIYAALLLHDSARESLDLYLNARVLKRIGSAPTVDSRFYILGKLFMELLPAMLLTGLLWLIFYFKKMPKIGNPNYKMAFVYALIGLSAAAPMMLTLVQKGFYIVPCFPFFGVSLALLIAPYLAHWTAQLQTPSAGFRWSKRAAWVFLLMSMIFAGAQVGKASRDEAMLHDVYLMGKVIPAHSAISVSKSLATDWSVHMYFMRHFYISLDKNVGRDFFLQEKTSQKVAPNGFKLVNLASQKYDLFVRE